MMGGKLDEGLADLNEAIRIDPYGPYAYWNRAELYRYKGDFASARADYERALSLGPRQEDRPKIEAALNAVKERPDPSIITDPAVFEDSGESTSSDSSGPPEAMPASPAEPPAPETAPVEEPTVPPPPAPSTGQ